MGESGGLNLPKISNRALRFRNDLLSHRENDGGVDRLLLFLRSVANERGKIVAAVYRVARPTSAAKFGLALRLMVEPRRAMQTVPDATRATA